MKKILLLAAALLLASVQSVHAQSPIAIPKASEITVKQTPGNNLVIPIEVSFVNNTGSTLTPTITIAIDNGTGSFTSQFNAADIPGNIYIVNNAQAVSINAGETKSPANTCYLFIGSNVVIGYEKTVYLRITDNNGPTLASVKVIVQPQGGLLSLHDYFDHTQNNKLDEVTKVESADNTLTVSGYLEVASGAATENLFLKRTIGLSNGEVLAISERSWIFDRSHWRPLPLSITTIPFKVRPGVTLQGHEFKTAATSGISNLGFNLDLCKYQLDRYFTTAKKSTHKFSLGFWAAPSVEELDSVSTFGANGAIGKLPEKTEKSKQLFVSTGLTISYTYNDISFVIVPAGWDIATTSIGRSWVYNQRWWWGFGIAISPKIFATILNK